MAEWSSAPEDGDGTEAARRFRVEAAPASRSRRLVTFVPSMIAAVLGEMASRWPPHTTRVVDLRSGRCVFEPEKFGHRTDYAELLQAHRDRMSVEEFCEQWTSTGTESGCHPALLARRPGGRSP